MLTDESYLEWGRAAGVGGPLLDDRIAAHAGKEKVDADVALATHLGARSTPTFFINGVRLLGAHPIEKFETMIDAEALKAKARLDVDVPAARIYVEMTNANFPRTPDPLVDY